MTVLAVRAPLGWLGPGGLVEEPLVVLDGGRIAYAGPSAGLGVTAVGASGPETLGGAAVPPEPDEELHVDGFLMPGVVDRHVHIGLADPGAVVLGGVTAVRDLGWPPDVIFSLAGASESPSFTGPIIRGVGPMITCPEGYPTRAGWAPPGTGLEVSGPEEAARAVASILGESGVAVVKVALNAEAGPTLPDQDLAAICDTAHAAGATVTCHAQGAGQVERALGAGVDEFAHTPWTERLPDAVIEAMAARVRVVSTLDIQGYGRDTPDLRRAVDNLGRFLAAGGRVAYGTDLGNGPIPPGIHLDEARHLRRAGVSAEALLEVLTFRPLAAGEPADLLAVAGNPIEDLDALGELQLVIRAGRRVR